jgi:hypothetical protein
MNMIHKSEREERTKQFMEWVKIVIGILGVGTLFIGYNQLVASNLAAKETVYQRMTSEWRDHLKTFVEKPQMRPYFEEGKQLTSSDSDTAQAVLALADVRLDTADAILTYAAMHGASARIDGWKNTFARAFKTSPTLCSRLSETKANYGLIVEIGDKACRDRIEQSPAK